MRTSGWLVSWFAVGLVFGLSVEARAAPRSCPPGTRPSLGGCVDGARNARVRATTSVAPSKAPSAPAPDPALRLSPAGKSALDRANQVLLVAEIARLESVLKKTAPNSPDRALLVRRIAEAYAELAALAERSRARAQEAADRAARPRAPSDVKKPVPAPAPAEPTVL